MRAARRAVFGGTRWQRCQFHLAQNAIHHAPNVQIRAKIGSELRQIWNQPTLAKAEAALAELVREFLRYTDVLPWSDAIAPHYGTLRAALEAKGVTIAPLDLMIAANALAIEATLVSADQAVSMIDILKVEDWSV